jgi:hypothetical protein
MKTKSFPTETLLITVDDGDNNRAWAFEITHMDNVYVREAVSNAFRDFAKTNKGKEYIKQNGTNWGDALFIPDKFLRKHGILCVKSIVMPHDITVDHNESLLD